LGLIHLLSELAQLLTGHNSLNWPRHSHLGPTLCRPHTHRQNCTPGLKAGPFPSLPDLTVRGTTKTVPQHRPLPDTFQLITPAGGFQSTLGGPKPHIPFQARPKASPLSDQAGRNLTIPATRLFPTVLGANPALVPHHSPALTPRELRNHACDTTSTSEPTTLPCTAPNPCPIPWAINRPEPCPCQATFSRGRPTISPGNPTLPRRPGAHYTLAPLISAGRDLHPQPYCPRAQTLDDGLRHPSLALACPDLAKPQPLAHGPTPASPGPCPSPGPRPRPRPWHPRALVL